MATVHELPPEVESMCGFCLAKATHFLVVRYSYGQLPPVCPKHATETMY